MNSQTEYVLRTLVEKIMANGAETAAQMHAEQAWRKQHPRLLLEMAQPRLVVLPPTMGSALRTAYLEGVRAGAYQALEILQGLTEARNAAQKRAEGRGDAEGGEVPA